MQGRKPNPDFEILTVYFMFICILNKVYNDFYCNMKRPLFISTCSLLQKENRIFFPIDFT